MNRELGAAVAVLALVGLAGCAQIAVDSTVSAEGEIESYGVTVNTSTTVYGFLNREAINRGHADIGEMWIEGIDRDDIASYSYNETVGFDEATLRFRIEGWTPGPDSDISITESGGTLVYEDTMWVNETAAEDNEESGSLSGLTVRYRLTMPGEITDSNADEVDGTTATWETTGPGAMNDNRIYAESDLPSSSALGPGFGFGTVAVLGVVALLLGIGLARAAVRYR